MSHVGTSLVIQPHYKEHGEVSLTNEEKYVLRKEVFKAGRHLRGETEQREPSSATGLNAGRQADSEDDEDE